MAIKAGIPYYRAMHMTPNAIYMHIRAYEEQRKEQLELIDFQAWRNGLYHLYALGAGFGNADYPEQALMIKEIEDKELTEEERLNKEIEKALAGDMLWSQQLQAKGLPVPKCE